MDVKVDQLNKRIDQLNRLIHTKCLIINSIVSNNFFSLDDLLNGPPYNPNRIASKTVESTHSSDSNIKDTTITKKVQFSTKAAKKVAFILNILEQIVIELKNENTVKELLEKVNCIANDTPKSADSRVDPYRMQRSEQAIEERLVSYISCLLMTKLRNRRE